MSDTRSYPVAMSVDVLASAWARTEDAADGALVVVDDEISGRLRGGTPWRLGGDDALMLALVVRPTLPPLQEALLWLPASLGAAEALSEVSGIEHSVVWPDQVSSVDSESPRCSTNVLVQLGPGRIEHAVIAIRVDLRQTDLNKEELVRALSARVLEAVRQLEADRLAFVDRFTNRCSIIGQRVTAERMPRGQARGRATAIDPDGFLVLESPTGMLERVAPATLRSLVVHH